MNDFGRQVEIQHRYDDFAKLHESLTAIPGIRLSSLPPKAMFAGNDPKVIEERRPVLEKLAKDCVITEAALSDERDNLCKFLDMSPAGAIVVKFLCVATRYKYVFKLAEVMEAPATEHYRLFNEPVIRVLLHVLSTTVDLKTMLAVLDVLQFILSRAHNHPLSKSVDVQKIFGNLGGISTIWSMLVSNRDVREHCRRALSSLITSNADQIYQFENLMLTFLKDQNGLSLLFDSSEEQVHEIVAKLLWFGLSGDVGRVIASHPQGLALLGKLYLSSDSNARCLAGLTLSVLITRNSLDPVKSERAIEGVTSILSFLVTATTNLPSQAFLSAVCRGSSKGLDRIVSCIEHGQSPMSDFCSYVILHAELAPEWIDNHKIFSTIESAILKNEPSSVIGMNCARFLFRHMESDERLPSMRTDGRIADLIARIREGLAAYNKSSKKLIENEHSQFSQFHRASLLPQLSCIKAKNVSGIEFGEFDAIVKQYIDNQLKLEQKVTLSDQSLKDLNEKLSSGSGDGWTAVSADLVKEWNQSLLGMTEIRERVAGLETVLAEQESRSKSAGADADNLQQVLTSMRQEIVAVDAKAEEYRKESSRFSGAAAGAVDSQAMLQKAQDCESKAKEEIAKREALRQSQDSLEAQLDEARKAMVVAETEASQTRKVIADAKLNVAQGEKMHAEVEGRLRAELKRAIIGWNGKLENTREQLVAVENIVHNFNDINRLIETENEHKDILLNVIGALIEKLQRLQNSLQ